MSDWEEIVSIASRAKYNGDCGGGYSFVGKDAAASALMELRSAGYEIVKADTRVERLREAGKKERGAHLFEASVLLAEAAGHLRMAREAAGWNTKGPSYEETWSAFWELDEALDKGE